MPMPRWLAHINKRVFNPMEIKRGARPVLIHTGRRSGATYRTPMDAHRLSDGFVFIPMYGPKTDWVKNVIADGHARLLIDGKEIQLDSPRLVRKAEIWSMLPPKTKTPPGINDDTGLLRMNTPN